MSSASPEYQAVAKALREIMEQKHNGAGEHDPLSNHPLTNAAMDVWHDVLRMGWQERWPEGLLLDDADDLADYVGRAGFGLGVLVGSRLRDA